MKLTPIDIKKHEFSRSFRGCDPDEVRAFLEMVADEMMSLLSSLEELRHKSLQTETQLNDYKELEEKWKTTMINAQESAERTLELSRREAEIMRREAEIKAEEILDGARQRVIQYKEELEILRQEKRALITRLKHLLNSQVELLEVLEKEEGQPGEAV